MPQPKKSDPIDLSVTALESQIAELEKSIQPTRDEIDALQKSIVATEDQIQKFRDAIDVLTGHKSLAAPGPARGGRGRGTTSTATGAAPDADAVKRWVGDQSGSGASAGEVAKHFDTSTAATSPVLKALVESGDLVKGGKLRGTRYFGTPWADNAKSLDEAQGV